MRILLIAVLLGLISSPAVAVPLCAPLKEHPISPSKMPVIE